MQAICPRGFERLHGLQGIPYFLIRGAVCNGVGFFPRKGSTLAIIPNRIDGGANLLGLIKLLEVIAKYVFNLINVVHPFTIVIKNT